jgi:hypothetical protein
MWTAELPRRRPKREPPGGGKGHRKHERHGQANEPRPRWLPGLDEHCAGQVEMTAGISIAS